nr:MAG TPA: hypothetical protein [Caudoviricetes sp.]
MGIIFLLLFYSFWVLTVTRFEYIIKMYPKRVTENYKEMIKCIPISKPNGHEKV